MKSFMYDLIEIMYVRSKYDWLLARLMRCMYD